MFFIGLNTSVQRSRGGGQGLRSSFSMPSPCQHLPLECLLHPGTEPGTAPLSLPDECTMLDKAVNPTPADRAGHGCWPSVLSPLFNKGTSFFEPHLSEWGRGGGGNTGWWALRNQREEDL